MARIHIVGAGMAGLAAAVRLAPTGHRITLHEAANHAGGRCRSFHDAALDRVIDNGNHLLLSGNRAVSEYLETIGAADTLVGPDEPAFHFYDLQTDERWCVRPNLGPLPWWIFSPRRRVPGTTAGDYMAAVRFACAGEADTVTDTLDPDTVLFRRYWEPLAVSVLNTPARHGAAKLLWPVIVETFGRGGRACRPMIAKTGLSDSFVEPALAYLGNAGVSVRFGDRLREVRPDGSDERIGELVFSSETVSLAPEDHAILALPASMLGELMPHVPVPHEYYPIVNVHFRTEAARAFDEPVNFLGIIGGTAEWLFFRDGIISVTVSAARDLAERSADDIIRRTWGDIAMALRLSDSAPQQARVVKEKRATFAQTPASLRLRASTRAGPENVKLAGDWTDTGVPATVEGALRSGNRAAEAVLRDLRQRKT